MDIFVHGLMFNSNIYYKNKGPYFKSRSGPLIS